MPPLTSPHGDDEEPLDPAAERIRQKLARLLLGSLGVMILGLVAVFGAILYKINFERRDVAPSAGRTDNQTAVSGRIQLPDGATVISTSLDGVRALLQFRRPDGSEGLLYVDLLSGQVISRQDLAAQ